MCQALVCEVAGREPGCGDLEVEAECSRRKVMKIQSKVLVLSGKQ